MEGAEAGAGSQSGALLSFAGDWNPPREQLPWKWVGVPRGLRRLHRTRALRRHVKSPDFTLSVHWRETECEGGQMGLPQVLVLCTLWSPGAQHTPTHTTQHPQGSWRYRMTRAG